ncbi:hypothetical protein M231_05620 [Tremella mesenterica]|uniref:Uncharacterized protein n=1 Tax=Tremella mesenterica TaxID=5217 RepID=A0A4Q1BHN8_TREME|nr:hypothetical protein M231_05620 [Tremella mesenterica]
MRITPCMSRTAWQHPRQPGDNFVRKYKYIFDRECPKWRKSSDKDKSLRDSESPRRRTRSDSIPSTITPGPTLDVVQASEHHSYEGEPHSSVPVPSPHAGPSTVTEIVPDPQPKPEALPFLFAPGTARFVRSYLLFHGDCNVIHTSAITSLTSCSDSDEWQEMVITSPPPIFISSSSLASALDPPKDESAKPRTRTRPQARLSYRDFLAITSVSCSDSLSSTPPRPISSSGLDTGQRIRVVLAFLYRIGDTCIVPERGFSGVLFSRLQPFELDPLSTSTRSVEDGMEKDEREDMEGRDPSWGRSFWLTHRNDVLLVAKPLDGEAGRWVIMVLDRQEDYCAYVVVPTVAQKSLTDDGEKISIGQERESFDPIEETILGMCLALRGEHESKPRTAGVRLRSLEVVLSSQYHPCDPCESVCLALDVIRLYATLRATKRSTRLPVKIPTSQDHVRSIVQEEDEEEEGKEIIKMVEIHLDELIQELKTEKETEKEKEDSKANVLKRVIWLSTPYSHICCFFFFFGF